MPKPRPEMELTAELVALIERTEPDPGPPPGRREPTEAELRDTAARVLADRPSGPIWLFAYGSLIWKPELEHLEARRAHAHGWHRRFCMRLTRWRGTREVPGLMMALDRGGSCAGVAYRLDDTDHARIIVPRNVATHFSSPRLTANTSHAVTVRRFPARTTRPRASNCSPTGGDIRLSLNSTLTTSPPGSIMLSAA